LEKSHNELKGSYIELKEEISGLESKIRLGDMCREQEKEELRTRHGESNPNPNPESNPESNPEPNPD